MKLSKTIEFNGHIIDSLILPRAFDEILAHGGDYVIEEISIGKTKKDKSYARMKVMSNKEKALYVILEKLKDLGAIIESDDNVILKSINKNGVWPEGFYSTTNFDTYIRYQNKWIEVEDMSMDCAIKVNGNRAKCVKMSGAKKGDKFVVSSRGVQVRPESSVKRKEKFSFMSSGISSEKPNSSLIKGVADEMKLIKKNKEGKILFVCGPAIVHTGSRDYLAGLIKSGYVDILFAGNALAVHDIEASLFGTSLGVNLDKGSYCPGGHRHHLRAINTIRSIGGIKKAVEKGILKDGIMHSCIKAKCDFVLAGSIRDDGPLPEVITDVLEAQKIMKEKLKGVSMAVMISTMLHSVAVGNLLPARVKTICVDINPSTVTKLSDRGTHQAIGIISDAGTFLRSISENL